jgi:hypothetical protein
MKTSALTQAGLDRLHQAMAARVENRSLPGIVTLVAQGDDAYSFTVSVAGVVAGHLTFTSGSGGLAGLQGEGTFTAGTYSYKYRFAP